MRTAPEQRDPRKRCDFYRDHGHGTKNCYDLKERIEELVRNGELQECVQKLKIQIMGNGRQVTKGPASDNEEPINYIIQEQTSVYANTSASDILTNICMVGNP
ncbi:hypothetical protein ACOSQ3_024787 [Xanthoceras sorbifolium]